MHLRIPDMSASAVALFFSSAAAVALVLASCNGLGSSCQFDSDCSGGSLCIEQSCYATCSSQTDCEPPYDTCEVYTRTDVTRQETVKICVGDDFNNTNNDAGTCQSARDCCTTDQQCVEAFGDPRAECGIDNRCIIPVPPPLHGVLIRDRTAVDTSSNPADGGLGADIAAIYVRAKGSTEPIGWAQLIEYAPANDANGLATTFDGQPKALDASGECVSADFDAAAVPLGGQGGQLLVSFSAENGQRLELNEDWQVVVIEWGANCGATADADSYDAYFCESAQGQQAGDIDPQADCPRQLDADGPISGYQVLSLSPAM